jgi:hypothetical protein
MLTIAILVSSELILFLVFLLMKMYKNDSLKGISISILKGWIERAFLTIGLYLDIPLVLILFSALKLGTRLRQDDENRISNDQFLIGNLLSAGASIGYAQAFLYL